MPYSSRGERERLEEKVKKKHKLETTAFDRNKIRYIPFSFGVYLWLHRDSNRINFTQFWAVQFKIKFEARKKEQNRDCVKIYTSTEFE